VNKEAPQPQGTPEEHVQWAREWMRQKSEERREFAEEFGLPPEAVVGIFAAMHTGIHDATDEEALASAKELFDISDAENEIFAGGQDVPKNSEPPLDRNK
jgi:hypothetical protein